MIRRCKDAVSDQVQQLVSSALGGGALGEAVGAQGVPPWSD